MGRTALGGPGTVASSSTGVGSDSEFSGAWANKRESEEGRTGGDEPADRDRTGNICELGGWVTWKVSSNSASGGPGGRPGASNNNDISLSLETLREETLRLVG